MSTPGERVAVYPGSFDPLTNGHVDITLRGARLFDRIIVAILRNAEKHPLFTLEERESMARRSFANTRTSTSRPSTVCWWTTPPSGGPR